MTKKWTVCLWLVALTACGGRTASEGTDAFTGTDGKDAVSTDKGKDYGKTDLTQIDGVSPVDPGYEDLPPFDPGLDTEIQGTPIYTIQSGEPSVQCTNNAIETISPAVDLAPVVIIGPKYVASKDKTTGAPKLDGYYAADLNQSTSGKYRGAQIVVDSSKGTNWQPGEVVKLTVDYVEYYCMTELKVTDFKSLGAGKIPQPLAIDPTDVGSQDPETAEPLEGVYVTVEGVEVTNANPDAPSDYGQYEVTGGLIVANDYGLDYANKGTDKRKVGDKIKSLSGFVKYSYGKYVLVPPGNDAVVFEVEPPVENPPETVETTEVVEAVDVPDIPEVGQDVVETVEIVDVPETVAPTGKTVYETQSAATSVTCTNEANTVVADSYELADVVVTTPQFSLSGSLHGYYVRDQELAPKAEYAGMLVAVPKSMNTAFMPGDVVHFKGKLLEYYCMTELSATEATQTGSVAAAKMYDLDASVFAKGGDKTTTEPYEGVLVTISNVEITSDQSSDGKGWFQVGDGIEIANDFKVSYTPVVGKKLASISGAVKYHWGKYRIEPWAIGAIVEAGETPDIPEVTPDIPEPEPDIPVDVGPQGKTAYEIQSAPASVDCTVEANTTVEKGIAFAKMIVLSPKYSESGSLDGYFAADYPAASDPQYTGMLITVAKSLATAFVPGDIVLVVGDYKEYYCLTEIAATAIEKVGSDTPYAPTVVPASVFENGGDKAQAEAWEDAIVTVQNVQVTSTTSPDGKGWFQVGAGIEVANFFKLTGFTPAQDQAIKSLTGAVKYHWGKYRISPRTIDDIVL